MVRLLPGHRIDAPRGGPALLGDGPWSVTMGGAAVDVAAPVIGALSPQTFTAGEGGTYDIGALTTGEVTQWIIYDEDAVHEGGTYDPGEAPTDDGLEAWESIDANGVYTVTSSAVETGARTLTVVARNAAGEDTATFSVTVEASPYAMRSLFDADASGWSTSSSFSSTGSVSNGEFVVQANDSYGRQVYPVTLSTGVNYRLRAILRTGGTGQAHVAVTPQTNGSDSGRVAVFTHNAATATEKTADFTVPSSGTWYITAGSPDTNMNTSYYDFIQVEIL